ncbi:MAG: AI-2E family transporter [Deltaproteobacteria bacterium]|nr:MAG: AI-2E family transporter [Deltaproteobacteria bacterium]
MSDDRPSGLEGERREGWWTTVRRFSRLWGFLFFLVFVVLLFRSIILPFVFALLVAYLLAPAVARLEGRLSRVGSVIVLYLGIGGTFALFLGLLLPAVVSDLSRLKVAAPQIQATISEQWIPKVSAFVETNVAPLVELPSEPVSKTELTVHPLPDGGYRVDLAGARLAVTEEGDGRWSVRAPSPEEGRDVADALRHLVAAKGAEVTEAIGPMLQRVVTGTFGFLTKLLLTFMLAAFILVDLDRVNRFVRSLIPIEYREDFDELLGGLDRGLAGVIRGQLMICLVNGVLTYIGLLVFRIKYAPLLAVFAGVMSLIPIFGTIISSIPIALLALLSGEGGPSLGPAVGILVWIAGIHLVEANVLNPKIIGDSAHIHPVVVVFALLAGEHVYGLVGALLAVPVASMVQTIFLFLRARVAERAGEGTA